MVKIKKARQMRVKREVWRILVSNTEKRIGKKLPDDIRELVSKTIDRKILQCRFQRRKTIARSLMEDISKLEVWFDEFSYAEERLSPGCNEVAKKLVEDVYNIGDKSVVEGTWGYISEIWNLIKTVEEFLLKHNFNSGEKLSKSTANQFAIFYEKMYTLLVEKILAEYVFAISNYMKNHSEIEELTKLSKTYSKNYIRAMEQGKNPKRVLILGFLKMKYQKSCPAVEETEWRDAVAHLNYYFDENNQKFYLNEKPKDVQELIKKYEQLCGFCCAIINEEFSRRNIFEWLKEVKKTAEILSS